MRRKLPIGIQTFREIREDNCHYVDKTPYIRSWWTRANTTSFPARDGSARVCSSIP